mgnify:CR=1 FL=1
MTESKRYDTSVEEIDDEEEELKDIDPKRKSQFDDDPFLYM